MTLNAEPAPRGLASAAEPLPDEVREADLPPAAERDVLRDVLRPLVGILANVTVLTALLIYFGWRRSETQAQRLGIDESVLAMSTREYLLRRVAPVLVMLVGVGVAGLVWLAVDQRVAGLFADKSGRPEDSMMASAIVRLLTVAWLVLPVLVWLMGFVWPALAFVLFPASIGAGVLLLLYAAHLRQLRKSADHTRGRRSLVSAAFAILLVCVCLFWMASNYAEVLGARLARDVSGNVDELPGVTVYSSDRLFLDGPGVIEDELAGDEGSVRFRYLGLRLLEHTGGQFFLVSDGWTTTYGVVFVLRDDEGLRFDFVRDRRGDNSERATRQLPRNAPR